MADREPVSVISCGDIVDMPPQCVDTRNSVRFGEHAAIVFAAQKRAFDLLGVKARQSRQTLLAQLLEFNDLRKMGKAPLR